MRSAQRPVIGVTGPDRGGFAAWIMTALAIWRAGGWPRRIRPCARVDTGQLAALVIGGGSDIDPLHYGELPQAAAETAAASSLRDWLVALPLALLRILFARHSGEKYDPGRDAMERALVHHALAGNKPLLGICRGAQLINVTLGGTLHQRIDHFYVEGTRNLRSVLPRKRVRIEAGSRLAQILESGECQVNALHAQCVKEPGKGLRVSACEPNGVTQAIEHEGNGFVIGVQWHPEYLPQSRRQQRLFRALLAATRDTG
ncbi:gamma-glutamyl-gamma-aminobutyrate hydrolase family protein [Haliea sp. E17]|uniref:gamma-glutamyl-gamma-aminobutyrate hydrolase family protein n=1 Tax=Haliea sp. E17 TaxID=3401576 RepID=UPI003AB092D2